jgi:hypothetical protein
MKTTIYSLVGKAVIVLSLLLSVGCLRKDDRTIMLNGGHKVTEIPSDEEATPNPDVEDPNVSIPNIITDVQDKIIRIDMSGILLPKPEGNPNAPHAYLRLYGTGEQEQNVWLSVDDVPKAVHAYNNIDGSQSGEILNDVVFLIDNSGSMDDEANAIARDIVEWAQTLSQSIDIRFAIVGYDGRITGAINFTTQDNIATYLNRSTGVYRTCGFSGDDAAALEAAAGKYGGTSATECPMMALHYANDNLAFREGANRVYVNFTDEPNESYGRDEYSVHYLASQDNWDPANGTIHTVYSSTDNQYNDSGTVERPWMMSEYTGGTVLFTNASFTGVSLNDLPVTGSMKNTYVVKFSNVMQYMDNKKHTIKLTVMTIDRMVRAEREYEVNFSEL